MSKAQEKALEGFICPSCVVDFPSALKLQNHWLNFHAEEENSCTASQDLRDKEPKDYEEILELPDGATTKVGLSIYNQNNIFFDTVFKSYFSFKAYQ